ncbi:MAG: response regulator [Cyclobacteriaceae bacterium]
MIRLVIVDDHLIVSEGVQQLLSTEFFVAGIFDVPQKALEFVRSHPVDMLVVDYKMPQMNGIEFFLKCRESKPEIRGIMLSMVDEVGLVKRCLKAGFQGFLLKNVDKTELSTAIRKIMQGHTYVSAEFTHRLLEPEEAGLFTERERQVLRLIVKEKTNRQIADELNISERTVETYRKNLFRKANTNNVVGLVKFAIAGNLID